MAQLAITGLISNLDVDGIISALLEIQRGPAILLENKRDAQTAKITALQSLNAYMLNLSVSARQLSNRLTYQQKQAYSSDLDVLAASASATAESGTYSIEVQSLASAQSIAGGTFSDNTEALGLEGQFFIDGELITVDADDTLQTLMTSINNQVSTVKASVLQVNTDEYRLILTRSQAGSGSIELFEVGSNTVLQDLGLVTSSTTVANPVTNGGRSGAFSENTTAVGSLLGLDSPAPSGSITLDDGSGPIHVTIDLETQSLENMADAINAEAIAQGSTITASVIEETEGEVTSYHLEITGAAPVSFTDDNNVLQTLQVLQPELADEVQAAEDAVVVINGVTITQNTNMITNVISGVTLALTGVNPGETVTLSVREDTSSVTSTVQNFVEQYNNARLYMREQTSYDPETQVAGILLGDSAVLSVERNMFNIMGTRVPNILLRDLSQLNGGSGVGTGTIRITDRSGTTTEIDLSNATSVQEVVDAINRNPIVSVTVSANAAGDGLIIKDDSGGTRQFIVEDLGSGTLAADLGLAGTTRSNSIYGHSLTDAGYMSLVNIGITSNNNGTLNLDLGALNQAMSNDLLAVQRLFTATDTGVGVVAKDRLQFVTQSSNGTISNRTEAIQNVIDDINDRLSILERRLLSSEVRLQKQFTALEIAMAEFQSQIEFFQTQFDNLQNYYRNN